MTPRRRRATRLRVAVTDARGRPARGLDARGLGRWLARIAPPAAAGPVAIALVSDQTMRRLNREYRGHDRVTDVLSFAPADVRRRGGRNPAPFLGDLAIARGRAAAQARRHGHSLDLELRILALHGLLHLLGYDHDTDQGTMARVEERLRRRGGLPPALLGRSNRPRP